MKTVLKVLWGMFATFLYVMVFPIIWTKTRQEQANGDPDTWAGAAVFFELLYLYLIWRLLC